MSAENARNLQGTTLSMAYDLDNARPLYDLDRTGFRDFLSQQAVGRALAHAALIRADGSFIMNAQTRSDFDHAGAAGRGAIAKAADGQPVLIEPRTSNIVGAIVKLRQIRRTPTLYDPAGRPRGRSRRARSSPPTPTSIAGWRRTAARRRSPSALLYLGLTLVIVLSAIWTGIAVADRLVRPIRQLIGAADEVATGNLDVSVPVRAVRRRRGLAGRHVQQDAAGS